MLRFFISAFILLAASCSPRMKIYKELTESEEAFQDHIGLMVYNPGSRKTLIDFNSAKYFTPASNTKIFTFFTGLQLLEDSIPALRYIEKGDSLIFWGTGDPSFLYPEVYQNRAVYDFLKEQPRSLYFSAANFYQPHFGPGWAWDDYYYSYSPERSSFPIYGNCMVLTDSVENTVLASPPFFQRYITVVDAKETEKNVERGIADNSITYFRGATEGFLETIPFHTSGQLIADLLTDTLKRKVSLVDDVQPPGTKLLYSLPADSLYKVMMQQSDNFLAEQLLQLCAGMISDSLHSEIAIEAVKKNFLFDLPDEPQWVDGSGLSRYNLFTPRSIVRLWEKILALVPRDRLFQMLAIGGKAGTIKNNYQAEVPYIFGKTGTLSNNHCLSGYLVTKSNELLIFSFMNNNHTAPAREVRSNMESILYSIHERY